MSRFSVKVYIVQRQDGEVVGAKLTFHDAHALAKKEAPARVLFAVADKAAQRNVMAYDPDQKPVKLIAQNGEPRNRASTG